MRSFRQYFVDTFFLIKTYLHRPLTRFLKKYLWFVYMYLRGGSINDIPIQNLYDLNDLKKAKKIVVFLIPSDDCVTGGIISIFKLCHFTRELLSDSVSSIISTHPGRYTYAKNSGYENDELVYRWEQVINNAHGVQELILHIPEYYSFRFYKDLQTNEKRFLRSIPTLKINILNQNINSMPKLRHLKDLGKLTRFVTQSVGFDRCVTQEVCDRYGMPLYQVPSFVDLESCIKKKYGKKKGLILYSPDQNPLKHRIINKLKKDLNDFELREIRNIKYLQFLDLIADALFCISFGEGFDGYYIQPYYAGSIGISVYNDSFFPDSQFKDFPFVYSSYEKMEHNIVDDIKKVYKNQKKFENISTKIYHYFQNNINKKDNTIKGLGRFYKNSPTFLPIVNAFSGLDSKLKKNKERFLTWRKPTDNFQQKVKALINSSSYYYYPETKDDYIPINKGVLVETSMVARWLRRRRTYKKFAKTFSLKRLEQSYHMFADEHSKEIFLMVALYSIYKTPILRYPLYYSRSFNNISKYHNWVLADDVRTVWFGMIKLKKYDLSILGYDIKLWHNPLGILIVFDHEQYRYKDIVKIEDGDWVIDGGACYGDTALYFATKTNGKIFSFEFMEENLEIFNENIDMNPTHRDQIVQVKKPLWDKTGDKVYSVFNGPGTCVQSLQEDEAQEFETVSIDDYVAHNNIEKVDFIKLDVEGSEKSALKGAVNTIRKFRPKLAICAYHKQEDLIVLPQLIKKIVPEYKLYLDHNTINQTETVIYAKDC